MKAWEAYRERRIAEAADRPHLPVVCAICGGSPTKAHRVREQPDSGGVWASDGCWFEYVYRGIPERSEL